ncbi:hypothetical protein [Mycobacterium montefiorense]|uniref:Uncharacterized protein n=1 Tax=Mycobacterium montefiorense TaxID=154654 RepID=A0AA37PMZ6_9MYCO|nr:hypothetical protein [Mycobacterium montefiorense]GKU46974.1 hypothetical protein NJB14194_35920 [Mycobacterium montefiorense]GKU49094.1 hypothetical protein NJB14195_03410 [Mycobacterium montefiorense]GKU62316.1 hypothetical protein NJB18182_28170 [Mycobacterium montefiorense]GKU66011.1 hypothetical protein NJB18183_11600 [Mycobacterium montefiorense]GKU73292.1 hypothetical protein NJB18185_30630 [Mycobacterium montefiorense]
MATLNTTGVGFLAALDTVGIDSGTRKRHVGNLIAPQGAQPVLA